MQNVSRYLMGRGPLGIGPDDLGIAGRLGRPIGPFGLEDPGVLGGPFVDGMGECFLGVGPLTPPTTTPSLQSKTDEVDALKSAIVRICWEEWDRWNVPRAGTKPGTTRLTERQKQVLSILQDYWLTGVKINFSFTNLKDKAWQDKHPWSAAFISWVMRKAGAGDKFKYSFRHTVYAYWAKQNRLEDNDSWFKLYRTSEVKAEPGDLVCKARAGSGATYDNLEADMKSHCDYVVEVKDTHLVTIGGNVSDSVTITDVEIDKQGFITQKGYFGVIRISDE